MAELVTCWAPCGCLACLVDAEAVVHGTIFQVVEAAIQGASAALEVAASAVAVPVENGENQDIENAPVWGIFFIL